MLMHVENATDRHSRGFLYRHRRIELLEDFVATAFSELGLENLGHQHVVQDPHYFRPTELRYSHGQAEKARRKLAGSQHEKRDVVREMIRQRAAP